MDDQEYINPFIHVHNKVKAFKDRLRDVKRGEVDLRDDRVMRETKEMEINDKEIKS